MTDHLRDTLQGALGAGHRIERELGGGGMSRVFVARDLSLDRDIVVKVLPGESTHGVNADRFRREIQVIARLQHPHIIPILAAGSAEGTLYYLMPFMGGETLRARLSREGPLSVSDTGRILREVLDALSFAHKHGVIHRDIKPENVLLEAGHAVVADFGIAKALRDSGNVTSAGISLGTPAYAAPEQAMADPTTDHRADLYAVGAMAYEMLTGAPVFGGSVQQVVAAHLTTTPVPLRDRRSDIPVPLADVIMRALAKEPAERPQNADEMLAALDAAITPGATTPLPVAAPRRRRTWGYAAVAGAAVLAAAGLFAYRSRVPRAAVVEGAEVIAVLPLAAVSDSSLARLGQDLVVTLTSNFDGVGSLRTTDAVTVLTNARKLDQPIPLAAALALGRKLGAQSVLIGTLIGEGTLVRALVTLYRVDRDSAIAKATVVAAPTAIAALTDSITWHILRQVWRRGAAPSPMLTGLMTTSFDALRAFLDGEQRWQHLDVAKAKALYRRAFELDTNFAQAYLRHDYVTTWHGATPDSMIRRRLLELTPRLPERERAWLETRRAPMPLPAKFAVWRDFVARYPDYPPGLMAAADPIIHSGPLYGISLTEARPFIDRLVELSPEDGDAHMHQAFVAKADGREADLRASLRTLERVAGDSGFTQMSWSLLFAKGDTTHPFTTARADSIVRFIMRGAADVRDQAVWIGGTGAHLPRKTREQLFQHFRATGLLQGDMSTRSLVGEGSVLVSNGFWSDGLRTLQRAAAADLSVGVRITEARVAAIGAWLGAVDPLAADSALQRARALPGADSLRADRTELRWMDGLIGVTQGDGTRVQRAVSALGGDTSRVARSTARALRGLWLERTNHDAGADSLRAVSDDVMQNAGFLTSVEAVNRFVVARALRRRGTPALADRYLMWTESVTTVARSALLITAVGPLVAYERGVASDEAGDKVRAIQYLQEFADRYTNPPENHRPIVVDAKRRLQRLTADAAK